MTEPIKDRLARAISELEETRQAVDRAERQLRATTVTVRSKDRSVEVIVDAQGHLDDVRFLNGKYRTMGAAQLSAALIEAVRQAQADVARMVLDAFRPLSETPGLQPHVEGSGVEWDDIFGPLLETVDKDEEARRRAGDGLRDEITEDGEKG
ncbi:DNA-binding protein YbaB [Streptomyces sp. B3I7]|uniref:YbaB/EbfC family nucleoid-associated protein n=1 Tax=Streptomyces sp. B3I7 TaxID=3042269 RepID=UPI0027822B40|nr:YbaB/EbfC family nucleoid-associated protein [Streptomyces sp. B3I7]MDQ0808596.1 DNA-binding protein YbaB [Streptomyces sp. B3I7]